MYLDVSLLVLLSFFLFFLFFLSISCCFDSESDSVCVLATFAVAGYFTNYVFFLFFLRACIVGGTSCMVGDLVTPYTPTIPHA